MGQRGPKPKGKVKIEWSPNFAYAIGLLASDGCLSKDGRHIDFTSKDLDQVENFKLCLGVEQNNGRKRSAKGFEAYRVQIGDILFYTFLQSIGFSPAKSLIMGKIDVPKEYFFDFFRGCFDGDGSIHSYWDRRWRSSHLFYLELASGSKEFIDWVRGEIENRIGVKGSVTSSKKVNTYYQLKYAKKAAVAIINQMYYDSSVVYLPRKYTKIQAILFTEREQQDTYKNIAQVV